MACHQFVSHVTGYATFFGYELGKPGLGHALGMLSVPLFFLFGCTISGQLVDVKLKQNKRPKYYITFGLIFLLICVVFVGGTAGFFGQFGEPLEYLRDYTLLALLCLTCGIQNGTITTISRSVIRTIHLTGVITDLGIGIMRLFNRDKLRESIDLTNETYANFMRAGIIFFFGLGSVFGAYVFNRIGYVGFLAPVLSSLLILRNRL